MNRKIITLIFFFLYAIWGCINKQTVGNKQTVDSTQIVDNTLLSLLPVIDIVEGIEDAGSKMFLSEIAENIEFVQLEITNECVIGRPYNVFFFR